MLLSRLLMILLIPLVVTLSACSGNSGSSSNHQANSGGSGDGGSGDGGSGDGGSGDGGSGDGGSGDGGSGDGGSGDGNNSGIENGCVYAADNYQQPTNYPLTEYFDISLNQNTYSIRDGQEHSSADSDLTGTWLLVHNVTRQSTSSLSERINQSHYRMVFVIRDNAGQLEYAQCTAGLTATGQEKENLLPTFSKLTQTQVGDTITLPLNEITTSAQFKIASHTRLEGVTIDASSENSIRERVVYRNQHTQAVKISDSTQALGTLSLSAYGLENSHANKGVFCMALALTRHSKTECKNPTPQRSSNSFLTIRAEDKVRINTAFQASSDSSSELMLFRYDQDSGERYNNTLLEKQTNLANNGTPNSQVNLDILKHRLTGTMAISGTPIKNPNETGTANVSMDITIPLTMPD